MVGNFMTANQIKKNYFRTRTNRNIPSLLLIYYVVLVPEIKSIRKWMNEWRVWGGERIFILDNQVSINNSKLFFLFLLWIHNKWIDTITMECEKKKLKIWMNCRSWFFNWFVFFFVHQMNDNVFDLWTKRRKYTFIDKAKRKFDNKKLNEKQSL